MKLDGKVNLSLTFQNSCSKSAITALMFPLLSPNDKKLYLICFCKTGTNPRLIQTNLRCFFGALQNFWFSSRLAPPKKKRHPGLEFVVPSLSRNDEINTTPPHCPPLEKKTLFLWTSPECCWGDEHAPASFVSSANAGSRAGAKQKQRHETN